MKKNVFIMALIGIAVLGVSVFTACDDEPTQAEANEKFCDATSDYIAALRDVRDLDKNSSVDEFEAARDQAASAYESMIEASAGVVSVRLDELESARDDLQAAIDDVPEDATLGEGLEAVDDEIVTVIREVSQVLNDVDCGREPGDDTQSDE